MLNHLSGWFFYLKQQNSKTQEKGSILYIYFRKGKKKYFLVKNKKNAVLLFFHI